MYTFIYIAAICAANFSADTFGAYVTPINAFFLIGLDMVIRDKLHERIGVMRMMGLITTAGIISYTLNPSISMIAIASVIAFVMSSIVDAATYQALIRKRWLVKSNISNVASSAVDSILFPVIAFGVFMPWVVVGQFIAKVLGGALWSWLLRGVK